MKTMSERKTKMKEALFTSIKKKMTKKMYDLYYENYKDLLTEEEYRMNLARANKHLDACRFKDKGWPCPTCPECCFKGNDYEEMMTVMNYAQQWADENPKKAWKMKPPFAPHKH